MSEIKHKNGKKKYPDSLRYKAPIYWFYYRSWGKVARKLGVKVTTVRSWARTQWWDDTIQEIRDKYQRKLDNQYTHLLDKTAEELFDRLKNGEEKVTAKGDVVKVKVSARDLSTLLRDIQANRAMIRGEPTQRKESVSTEKKLDTIQNYLENNGVEPAKSVRKPYSDWLKDESDSVH